MKYTFVKYDQLCHSERSNEIAKSKNLKIGLRAVLFATIFLAACGDDNKNAGGTVEDGEVIAIVDKTVSGVSQKGPFVNGSSVTVQELDGETLAQTGNSYEGKIKNDMGEFSVKVTKLASQYALLKANGFYRNEVSGEKSKSQVTLYALTDLSNRDEVNVNLLTHLAYERSLYLASDDSVTVAAAKKRSEKEVLASFGMDVDFSNAEDLNIFGKGDESAALLAVSILMQGDLNEADFSERLADYAADIETDGKWDDSKTATDIADWAAAKSLGKNLSYIRTKIENWGLSADVPAFEKYVDVYWWENYGLGKCSSKREGDVLKNANSLSRNFSNYFICENGGWRVAYDTEYDTYQQKCDKDGKIVYGNVNKDYAYECDVKTWRHASNVEAALGGCIETRFGEVAIAVDEHYICKNRAWTLASDIEKDTATWSAGKFDGEVRNGQVNTSIYYIYEDSKKAWRLASDMEKDTYDYKKNKDWAVGKDGDSKLGSVNTDKCYVYEDSAWRAGNESDCILKLRGCTALRQDTVGLGSDKVWRICDSKSWRDATDIEKDTATWGAGSFNGEIRTGQINTTIYYIYESDKKAWRNATTLEKDTYDYVNNMDWIAGTDGEIKKGSITDSVYVYDASAWRTADDIEKVLGGCVATIADSVGKVGSVYYICTPRKWVVATVLQYDTYKKGCLTDGSIVDGNVILSNKYVCDEGVFRAATENDIRAELGCTSYTRGEFRILSGQYSYYKCETEGWVFTTEKLNQGTMTDERDGHVYKTIGIKTQMWMAQNLNYEAENSFCYNDDPANCATYGRLYTWAAATTACPSGWHLPSRDEFETLFDAVGGFDTNGEMLKSTSGWSDDGNGTDAYAFSALPAGFRYAGNYHFGGYYAYFWSSTEYSRRDAECMFLYSRDDAADTNSDSKDFDYSVRCLKD